MVSTYGLLGKEAETFDKQNEQPPPAVEGQSTPQPLPTHSSWYFVGFTNVPGIHVAVVTLEIARLLLLDGMGIPPTTSLTGNKMGASRVAL
jgi:hypothetical protein